MHCNCDALQLEAAQRRASTRNFNKIWQSAYSWFIWWFNEFSRPVFHEGILFRGDRPIMDAPNASFRFQMYSASFQNQTAL